SRGWVAQTQTGPRYVMPDAGLVERITAARCDALLEVPSPDDAVARLLAVGARVRLGEAPGAWGAAVARAAVEGARGGRRAGLAWDATAALDAAADVLRGAGEQTAAADVVAMRDRLEAVAAECLPPVPPDGIRAVAWLARRLVRPTADGADLL